MSMLEVFDEDDHLDGEVEVDDFAVGVAVDVFCCSIHFGYDALGVVFGDESGEVFAELRLFAVEVEEVGEVEVVDEVFADEPAGVVVEFDLLFASEGGEVCAPFFHSFDVALVGEAHEADEVVEEHSADACGIHGAEGGVDVAGGVVGDCHCVLRVDGEPLGEVACYGFVAETFHFDGSAARVDGGEDG